MENYKLEEASLLYRNETFSWDIIVSCYGVVVWQEYHVVEVALFLALIIDKIFVFSMKLHNYSLEDGELRIGRG